MLATPLVVLKGIEREGNIPTQFLRKGFACMSITTISGDKWHCGSISVEKE
jgi:hypothetical protein